MHFSMMWSTISWRAGPRTGRNISGSCGRRTAAGELLLAGAFTDPADRALLVFRAPDRSAAEDFARNDPYVIRGLVTRWEVRSWAVVIGNEPSEAIPTGGVR